MVTMKVGDGRYDFIISEQTINCLRRVREALPASERSGDVFHHLVREFVWQANKEKLQPESQVRDQYGDLMLPPVIEDDISVHVSHLLEDPAWLN
jgi:hypothetical protein